MKKRASVFIPAGSFLLQQAKLTAAAILFLAMESHS
jgi:hypothetical protein